jgi:DNA-directed RNA polymerase specialized sigma24 family protein
MISHLFDSDTTAQRCLDLIARHAPRLMRCGGGGLSTDGAMIKLTPERRRTIVALRRSGWRTRDIAKRVVCAQPTVSRVCREAGLVFRVRRVEPEELDRMRRLRGAGWTYGEIAVEVGFSLSTVQANLRGLRAGQRVREAEILA